MHGSRRRMSINKWKKVEKLYRKGKLDEAHRLGCSHNNCGHCIEYNFSCFHCPLNNTTYFQCNELVTYVNGLLTSCSMTGKKDRKVLPAIRKVQKLVAEK